MEKASSAPMKTVSFIVPAFNAAPYLDKCLQSLCIDSELERIEVLVVDDGSTDNTAEIASRYARKYPGTVFLLQKTNGGHGSAINTAVKKIAGKFLKPIDADDWILSENLSRYLDDLEHTDADVVLHEFQSIHMTSGRVITFPFHCRVPEHSVSMEEFMSFYSDIRDCCSFHGITYRTETFLRLGYPLTEGVYYEDQEYATVYFAAAERIQLFPYVFYQYLVGNANQSIAFHNQVKRIGHIRTVLEHILDYWNAQGPFSDAVESLFLQKMSVFAASYYSVALMKNPNRREGRSQAAEFSRWLQEKKPDLYARTTRKRVTMEIMNHLHISANVYQMFLDTPFYLKIRDFWTR